MIHSYSIIRIALASRYCFEDGIWDVTTNITQCQSIELSALRDIIIEQSDILDNNTNTEMMDLTTLFDIDEVDSVSEELSMLTNTSSAIVPNDLVTTNIIIKTIVRSVILYIYIYIASLINVIQDQFCNVYVLCSQYCLG